MLIQRRPKYNPAFLSEDELVQTFAARRAELEILLQIVRENCDESNQHVLVIGPRGFGKTTLALRIVAEIHRASDLESHWYPLVFSEESYHVASPGEFWLEALYHLARHSGDSKWERTHAELQMAESDEMCLRVRSLAQLMDFADAEGKRILLVVENFDMLLDDQMTSDDAWILRHTLLNEPRIMLLATATSGFEGIESPERAMYGLFRTLHLDPLQRADCCAIWESVTGRPIDEPGIRPIQILTGGNPRFFTIISTFAVQRSLCSLMDDLLQLVDDHTEYFKNRLDRLAPKERKAFMALVELWDPATAREVAARARLEVSLTSAQLGRLETRGVVTVVEKRGRTKWYQVAERMYNIYYLLRRRGGESERVSALVRFMVSYYPNEELASATRRIAEGERAEALQAARRFLGTQDRVPRPLEDAIDLVQVLAVNGLTREALALVRESPNRFHLEPLVVGLRLLLGERVLAATEILEVGRDVAEAIRMRRLSQGNPKGRQPAGRSRGKGRLGLRQPVDRGRLGRVR